jgi:hypothetical protein
MIEPVQPIVDRHLDVSTLMSCKKEPACFAFLCANATMGPQVIDRLHFDIASADYHNSRATVWATLDMRDDAPGARAISLLGFDESFLRPFTRAVLETGLSRIPHRIAIAEDPARAGVPRVVDYIRSQGVTPLEELVVTPFEHVLAVTVSNHAGGEETLFQIPRTDSFLKMFARMSQVADLALRDMLHDLERAAGLGKLGQADLTVRS